MSILDKFLSGSQKKNRGHLANIVKMAQVNGKISDEEIKLLKNIQKDLNISDLVFKKIVKKPDSYPMNPPANYEVRIERLCTLTNMLLVDKESHDLSVSLLEKLAVGIGFPLKTHKEVVAAAVDLGAANVDMETFSVGIKKANNFKE